jgi:hypothetical protein
MTMTGSVNFATNQGERGCGGQRKEGNRDASKNHRYNKKWRRSGMKLAVKLPLNLSKAIKTL